MASVSDPNTNLTVTELSADVAHFRHARRQAMVESCLGALCPSQSMTSVAAIHGLEASRSEKTKLDPVGECV